MDWTTDLEKLELTYFEEVLPQSAPYHLNWSKRNEDCLLVSFKGQEKFLQLVADDFPVACNLQGIGKDNTNLQD